MWLSLVQSHPSLFLGMRQHLNAVMTSGVVSYLIPGQGPQ